MASVTGFQPEAEIATRIAVEAGAEGGEFGDQGGGGVDDPFCHGRVTEPVAGGDRVAKMFFWAVIRTDRGGQAALGPGACRLLAERGFGKHQNRFRRQMKCCHESRQPGADDDRAAIRGWHEDGHIASIRSTAMRARAAMAGLMVTS